MEREISSPAGNAAGLWNAYRIMGNARGCAGGHIYQSSSDYGCAGKTARSSVNLLEYNKKIPMEV